LGELRTLESRSDVHYNNNQAHGGKGENVGLHGTSRSDTELTGFKAEEWIEMPDDSTILMVKEGTNHRK
jgi:hypothetical protein